MAGPTDPGPVQTPQLTAGTSRASVGIGGRREKTGTGRPLTRRPGRRCPGPARPSRRGQDVLSTVGQGRGRVCAVRPPASWDAFLEHLARRFAAIEPLTPSRDRAGPDERRGTARRLGGVGRRRLARTAHALRRGSPAGLSAHRREGDVRASQPQLGRGHADCRLGRASGTRRCCREPPRPLASRSNDSRWCGEGRAQCCGHNLCRHAS